MTGPTLGGLTAASSLFLLASALAQYSYSIIDYENPLELEKARAVALRLPFAITLSTHGWQNIVSHKILSPEAFATSCRQYMDGLSFPSVVSFHQKLKDNYAAFPMLEYLDKIPHPTLWKEKFADELCVKTAVQLLASYPFTQLKTLNLLPEEEISRLEKIATILETVRQTETSRKEALASHLETLQENVTQVSTKQQKESDTKRNLLTQWLTMDIPPSLKTMAQTFSTEEMAILYTNTSGLEAQLGQLHEQLEALNAHKVM